MKKLIWLIVVVGCIASSAHADIYVCLDKENGEVRGTADINPDCIADWSKTYTMKKADASYRGLTADEVAISNGKLSKASKEDIAKKKEARKAAESVALRIKALEALGLTETDLANVKKLK